MREFKEQRAPRALKVGLTAGWALLFLAGITAAVFLGRIHLGVVLFALGAILFAIRGYLRTGDKVVAGALIFVALVAMGIEAIVFLLGP
ncbi:hypothetical protein E0L93_08465 [Rubrobacter taiwanensis]|jgi:hypothetical protein|uniref:Uncharacterized protein n=1 Tax=Rubrobacter taiwanensis TaxID=185139 RepID=A0A4R1BHS7_9ACTN|nr:hypothetical protein [Rubrobacter taiwanensis]TCJ16747.1 hypothetical protein E0L93_08465 [Rubrobacter taiwanensis]